MVETFGHLSLDVLFFPHMTLVVQLLEDPGTLLDVIVDVLKRLLKAPISALEPYVGSLVRLLERDGEEKMVLHKILGVLLQRLPIHWLAFYFSHIMRAWNTALVNGWGMVEEEVEGEDDDDRWQDDYFTGEDYCLKMEKDEENW